MASLLIDDGAIAAEATGQSSNTDVPLRLMPFDGTNPPASLDGSLIMAGPVSGGTPAPAPNPVTGVYAPTSFEDWYYRIHFSTVQMNLGNLVGNQQREISLWNAFFVSVTLNDFQVINGAGINVIEPVTTPYVMRPLEELKYQFSISANGPPVINAIARWTINGIDTDVPITGRRVVLMPFKPNWSAAVEETLECLTTVQRSYDNSYEQVMEIRGKGPRRTLQYQVRLHGNAANLFDNLIFGWQGRVFATPLWHEETNLQGDTFTGATVLNVNTEGRTFQAGSLAVLYGTYTNFEIVEILTASPSTITLARPTEFDWPSGTEVIPAMVCYMEATSSTRRASDTHMDSVVRFVSSPADNYPRFDDDAPPLTYRGEELYVGKTNWIQPMQINSDSAQTNFDANGTGVFRVTRKASFPILQRDYAWTKKGKAENELLRKFFARRRGRLKNVWLSSGVRDFQIIDEALSSQTSFKVADTQYGALIAMHPARCHVLIELRSGSYIARQILDYQLDSLTQNGIVSLDSPLGTTINPQNVKRISFLGLYRMSVDGVTFAWQSIEICAIEANFTLKQPV